VLSVSSNIPVVDSGTQEVLCQWSTYFTWQ